MRQFLSPRWLFRHALMVALVTAFGLLAWWQAGRAAGGNTLSIAYAVEWPVFALFVIGLWIREIRTEVRAGRPDLGVTPASLAAEPPRTGRPIVVPVHRSAPVSTDPALSAYNEYLTWLAANPGRRPDEYRAVGWRGRAE